jgi:AcrR family transcriptional regulator
VRSGRPGKDAAGEVEQRILDAAEKLFVSKGFQTTSMDEVAAQAPASKPTIYAYFPNKESLFSAVVARIIAGFSDFEAYAPVGRTVEDQLTNIGVAVVERAMKNWLGITRATIAEAERFPDLSRSVHDASRDKAIEVISILVSEAAHVLPRRSKGPFDESRRMATGNIFLDIILLPMLMRALTGEDAKTLRKELEPFVRDRVAFFLAACERDWKQ